MPGRNNMTLSVCRMCTYLYSTHAFANKVGPHELQSLWELTIATILSPQKLCSKCVSRIYLAFIPRTPCHSVPVLPYPRITMHYSCTEVSSADKSQPLHLLFIENGSHDESLNKQTKHCTYFHFPCCLCFGMDLSGLISWNEDVGRGEDWRGGGKRKKYCSGRTGWEIFGDKKGQILKKCFSERLTGEDNECNTIRLRVLQSRLQITSVRILFTHLKVGKLM